MKVIQQNSITGNKRAIIAALVLIVLGTLFWVPHPAMADDDSGDKIVASGDHFVLTQKEVDAYKDYFKAQGVILPSKEKQLIRYLIKCELFAAEFKKTQKAGENSDDSTEEQKVIERKVKQTRQYTQKLLDEYQVPNDAVLSYYRSNPEKYASKVLDDPLKTEIKFTIVQAKTNAIIEQSIDRLILKYQIKISDDVKAL